MSFCNRTIPSNRADQSASLNSITFFFFQKRGYSNRVACQLCTKLHRQHCDNEEKPYYRQTKFHKPSRFISYSNDLTKLGRQSFTAFMVNVRIVFIRLPVSDIIEHPVVPSHRLDSFYLNAFSHGRFRSRNHIRFNKD